MKNREFLAAKLFYLIKLKNKKKNKNKNKTKIERYSLKSGPVEREKLVELQVWKMRETEKENDYWEEMATSTIEGAVSFLVWLIGSVLMMTKMSFLWVWLWNVYSFILRHSQMWNQTTESHYLNSYSPSLLPTKPHLLSYAFWKKKKKRLNANIYIYIYIFIYLKNWLFTEVWDLLKKKILLRFNFI